MKPIRDFTGCPIHHASHHKGLTEQDASALGFTLCRNMEEALQRAGSRQGREATIGVIPYCGETMVHVKEDREKFDEA